MTHPEHTQADRERWARQRLRTLIDVWEQLGAERIAGTLRACLGAVDRARVEEEERLLDAARDAQEE